jgi:hypothetical protein
LALWGSNQQTKSRITHTLFIKRTICE